MKKPLLVIITLLCNFIVHAQRQSYYYSTNKLDSTYTLPKFIGGNESFTKYITDNQKYVSCYDYPTEGLTITVSCYIKKDGKLTHIKFNKTTCPDCDSEAVRLLELSPKWQPGTHNGKPITMKISLMIALQVHFRERGDIVIQENLKNSKTIFSVPEKEPKYPGGIDNFSLFVKNKMNTSPDYFNVQGKVFVTFVIEKNGRLTHIQVLRSPHPTLSEEVLKAVRKSPRWIPGMIKDTAVRTQYTVAISFP